MGAAAGGKVQEAHARIAVQIQGGDSYVDVPVQVFGVHGDGEIVGVCVVGDFRVAGGGIGGCDGLDVPGGIDDNFSLLGAIASGGHGDGTQGSKVVAAFECMIGYFAGDNGFGEKYRIAGGAGYDYARGDGIFGGSHQFGGDGQGGLAGGENRGEDREEPNETETESLQPQHIIPHYSSMNSGLITEAASPALAPV